MDKKDPILLDRQAIGCDERTAQVFLRCRQNGDLPGEIAVLEHHRKTLLEQIHEKERYISCVDFVLYQLRKESSDKR